MLLRLGGEEVLMLLRLGGEEVLMLLRLGAEEVSDASSADAEELRGRVSLPLSRSGQGSGLAAFSLPRG